MEQNVMTPEEFENEMAKLRFVKDDDLEGRHVAMDELMCDVLRSLGYGDGIDIFNNTHKWYS